MRVGGPEILLLIGLALLLFGPNKIPEFARALGKATTEYKKGLQGARDLMLSDPDEGLTPEERSIIDAAEKLGIQTTNRSIEEVATDLIKAQNT